MVKPATEYCRKMREFNIGHFSLWSTQRDDLQSLKHIKVVFRNISMMWYKRLPSSVHYLCDMSLQRWLYFEDFNGCKIWVAVDQCSPKLIKRFVWLHISHSKTLCYHWDTYRRSRNGQRHKILELFEWDVNDYYMQNESLSIEYSI